MPGASLEWAMLLKGEQVKWGSLKLLLWMNGCHPMSEIEFVGEDWFRSMDSPRRRIAFATKRFEFSFGQFMGLDRNAPPGRDGVMMMCAEKLTWFGVTKNVASA
jgi:hypothetical protein